MKNTRAIILAAGRGSRMGEVTNFNHKSLTILNNRPLLHWQIDALNKAGISDLTVVAGYREELLQGAFTKVINSRWADTNMVASLFCVPGFDGENIISYADIVYKSNHITQLLQSNADITLTADIKWYDLWSKRFENPFDDAETFITDGNKLLAIGGKTTNYNEIQAQYMGLIKLNKSGWEKLYQLYNSLPMERKDKMDMTSLLSEALSNKIEISVVFVEGGWCEVDNYNDVLVYEKELQSKNVWTHNWQ